MSALQLSYKFHRENERQKDRKQELKKHGVQWRSAAAAAAASAKDVLTDERPITGWVSSLCAGRNSALMAFTDRK